MSIHEKIIDFVKSWLYYPKMCRHFMTTMADITSIQFMERYNNRWKYAWWHCRVGKMKDNSGVCSKRRGG